MKPSLAIPGLLLLVGGLLLVRGARDATPAEQGTDWSRELFGPFAPLAHDVAWIRFQRARLAGEEERALELASLALELEPSSTDGWAMLAQHLSVFLGSPERTPDLEARRAWFEAGLETALRGEVQAERPEELALWRGLRLVFRSELDPAVDPNGARGLLDRAIDAFDRAQELGHPLGAELATQARALRAEAVE